MGNPLCKPHGYADLSGVENIALSAVNPAYGCMYRM